jgi:steroid 5-alpha reductase family enzyme
MPAAVNFAARFVVVDRMELDGMGLTTDRSHVAAPSTKSRECTKLSLVVCWILRYTAQMKKRGWKRK